MEKLASYLKTAQMRPATFARQIGVTRSYISLLLSGGRKPGRAMSVKIESVTGGAVPVAAWDAGGGA